jgi:CRP-like cAMP-binding protein
MSATALLPSTILHLPKPTMLRGLREQHGMSDRFIAHMLARNIRIQEDLLDQMMNCAEQRLARILVALSRYGAEPGQLPAMSQDAMAQMVGTTRARVSIFMNKFKKQGYIAYGRDLPLTVYPSLHEMLASSPPIEDRTQ